MVAGERETCGDGSVDIGEIVTARRRRWRTSAANNAEVRCELLLEIEAHPLRLV